MFRQYVKRHREPSSRTLECMLFFIVTSLILTIIFDLNADYTLTENLLSIVPVGLELLVLLFTKMVTDRLRPSLKHYAGIAGTAAFSIIPVLSHPESSTMVLVVLFPLLLSVLSFEYKKIIFGLVCSLISLVVCYYYVDSIRSLHVQDLLLLIIYQLFLTALMFSIVQHSRDLMNHLEKSLKNNEQLMIQNVMMEYMNKTDPLTGLYNHMTFQEYLDKLIAHSEHNPFRIHLALIDVDNFKCVNDTYGHRAGDLVLKNVSLIIQKHAGPNDFAARYGGEEFTVIFTEKSTSEVYAVVESIRREISAHTFERLNKSAVTISTGINAYQQSKGKEDFFHGADTALYTAKRTGKNKTVFQTEQ
ncbi:GGDEF domain-containing protein [Paenibacillus sp. P96]|uniref:GGDEF domain-containing protein n=1 Tax=Paenibacillus zeirhizosphaerae TaxID=2987519 RepID=A0ABT9FLC0_9BACL|nr:GGDEF domain-containing protein [Paenibacillus sp. P96]MDP4095520.1 GGDEF domain-containing protein [Paenibacillus sp. P96]